jgi:prostaglandin-endoperoxide synthase 2
MLDNIPSWIAKPAVAVINHWDWLGQKVNDFAVNSTVNVCRPRPHPWSTAHPYVSWTSLSDHQWSARDVLPVNALSLL